MQVVYSQRSMVINYIRELLLLPQRKSHFKLKPLRAFLPQAIKLKLFYLVLPRTAEWVFLSRKSGTNNCLTCNFGSIVKPGNTNACQTMISIDNSIECIRGIGLLQALGQWVRSQKAGRGDGWVLFRSS